MKSQLGDFFVYLPTDNNKNRSFDSNNVTLKQKLNAVNENLMTYK